MDNTGWAHPKVRFVKRESSLVRGFKKFTAHFQMPPKVKHVSKRYREDLGMWEEMILVYGLLSFYRYTIRHGAQLVTKNSALKLKPKQAKYTGYTPLKPIQIGRKEFQEKYKGNRWLVPTNYELNLNRP